MHCVHTPRTSTARPPRRTPTPPRALLPLLPRPATRAAPGGLTLPPAGVGTWAWGNRFLYNYDPAQDAAIADAFDTALRLGIPLFDSGDSYGTGRFSGRAESLLGAGLARNPKAAGRVVIATKIAPYPWRLTAGSWVAALRGSLDRLGTSQMAIGQLHWSTANYAPWQEKAGWDGLIAAYDAGLIRAAGVSNYGPRQLAKVAAHLARANVPLATVQTQYSLLSCGRAPTAAIAATRDAGAVPLAYSPLALGALSGRYGANNVPRGPRGGVLARTTASAEAAGLLSAMDAVARATGTDRATVAIAWCVAKGTIPLVGCRTAAQVQTAARGVKMRLPGGAVEELDAAAARVKAPTPQNVFVTG